MAALPGRVREERREAGEEHDARATERDDLGVGEQRLAQRGEVPAHGLLGEAELHGERNRTEPGELGEHEDGALGRDAGVRGEEARQQIGLGRQAWGRGRGAVDPGRVGTRGDAPREAPEPRAGGIGCSVGCSVGCGAVATGEQKGAEHRAVDRLEVGAEPVEHAAHQPRVAPVQREQANASRSRFARLGAVRCHARA